MFWVCLLSDSLVLQCGFITRTRTYVRARTCTHVRAITRAHTHARTLMYARTYARARTHTSTHTYQHAYTYAHARTHTHCTNAHTQTKLNMYIISVLQLKSKSSSIFNSWEFYQTLRVVFCVVFPSFFYADINVSKVQNVYADAAMIVDSWYFPPSLYNMSQYEYIYLKLGTIQVLYLCGRCKTSSVSQLMPE